MGTREGKKIASVAPEKKLSNVEVIFHATSGNEYSVSLGENDQDQIHSINETITSAFGIIRITNDFALTAADGVTYHFNIDNVECVRVKVD